MISIEIDSEPDENWNKRLLDSSIGTIHQTKEFAIYQKTLKKQNPIFLKFISENGKIVGQITVNEYSRFMKKGLPGKILGKVAGQSKLAYKWKFGPIVFEPDYELEICNNFRKFLLSKKSKVKGSENPLLSGGLSNIGKPFKIKQWATFLINLSEDEKVLWKKMDKHSAQKNIKRSEKKGVSVREMSNRDLPIFYDIYHENKTEKNLNSNFFIFEKTWQILHKIGFTGFIAYQNDFPVGGIMVSSFNGYINEFNVARTKRDTDEKLYSQDLLKWKIIQWGKKNNLNYYDLTGVNPNPTSPKELGIFRYKKKWGGKPITYNLID